MKIYVFIFVCFWVRNLNGQSSTVPKVCNISENKHLKVPITFNQNQFEYFSNTGVKNNHTQRQAQTSILPYKTNNQIIKVLQANSPIVLDGKPKDKAWKQAQWHPLNQLWLGKVYSKNDFQGRYKLAWTPEALYLLAEIKDDVLWDQYPDPLQYWWDDDCLEIFIDEDNSGGEHQYNHNAFAYHIALDGNVVDISTQKEGKLYNSHINSKLKTKGNTTFWEIKISIFDDTYQDDGKNTPVTLYKDKNIGFALAYCDNDNSEHRENFIGSVAVEGNDKNRGWIDADIFGTIILVE